MFLDIGAVDLIWKIDGLTLSREVRDEKSTRNSHGVGFGGLCQMGTFLSVDDTAGFISGVVWSFALSYKLLQKHPCSDVAFWREAFLSQSRLLRYVPLWYLAPVAPGMALFFSPIGTGELPALHLLLPILVVFFSFVTWSNRSAAAHLESQASQL